MRDSRRVPSVLLVGCGALLGAAPALAAASALPYLPIAPCALLDERAAESLVEGEARVLAVDAERCPVPAETTAVAVEVRAVAATAPTQVVVAPGGPGAPPPRGFTAGREENGGVTVLVPVDEELRGVLAVQASLPGGGQTLVTAAVVGYLAEESTFSGSTGFITTRPTCVPPKYTPDPLNYLQGPEPIQLPDGDVTLLVGAGRCCIGHWEGLFSLTYPAAGKAATPRFHGLWATNDFSRQPSRKEAEVGFPSALLHGGKWRLALTTTFLPFKRPNRDRVGRIDLPNLKTRATTAQVTNVWVRPIDPKCKQTGSCKGNGSGLDPVLTLHPNGELFLYHLDGNYPACPSGYVRHRVGTDLSVRSSSPDACVTFEGLATAPFLISDIARTADGELRLLVEKLGGRGFIAEWASTGSATEIGKHWRPTGRLWPSPPHPNGAPWRYYVRDAAFLKDAQRTIVEPTVVVAQISDGRSYAERTEVRLGRWFLYWWAADGAVLPPTFGGPANGCALQGALEKADCSEVRGWAWDPMFPNSPITVEVLVDGVVAATLPADVFRAELQRAGRGDGRHGFTWPLPARFRDGRPHKVTVRYQETLDGLAGKARTIRCAR